MNKKNITDMNIPSADHEVMRIWYEGPFEFCKKDTCFYPQGKEFLRNLVKKNIQFEFRNITLTELLYIDYPPEVLEDRNESGPFWSNAGGWLGLSHYDTSKNGEESVLSCTWKAEFLAHGDW